MTDIHGFYSYCSYLVFGKDPAVMRRLMTEAEFQKRVNGTHATTMTKAYNRLTDDHKSEICFALNKGRYDNALSLLGAVSSALGVLLVGAASFIIFHTMPIIKRNNIILRLMALTICALFVSFYFYRAAIYKIDGRASLLALSRAHIVSRGSSVLTVGADESVDTFRSSELIPYYAKSVDREVWNAFCDKYDKLLLQQRLPIAINLITAHRKEKDVLMDIICHPLYSALSTVITAVLILISDKSVSSLAIGAVTLGLISIRAVIYASLSMVYVVKRNEYRKLYLVNQVIDVNKDTIDLQRYVRLYNKKHRLSLGEHYEKGSSETKKSILDLCVTSLSCQLTVIDCINNLISVLLYSMVMLVGFVIKNALDIRTPALTIPALILCSTFFVVQNICYLYIVYVRYRSETNAINDQLRAILGFTTEDHVQDGVVRSCAEVSNITQADYIESALCHPYIVGTEDAVNTALHGAEADNAGSLSSVSIPELKYDPIFI